MPKFKPSFWRHRSSDTARPLFRNHYADEWVGFLVLLAAAAFAIAVVEAGLLKEWLTPAGRIHFVLPQSDVAGLAVGNDIEIMGVHAGEIRKLELNDEGRMYAEGVIEPQFERFIRTDSNAVIRHRFVVAGASYIEITRGKLRPLDWDYAVLTAKVEINPADMITQTIKEVRARLIPVMDNIQAITTQTKDILVDLHSGKGTAGALLNDKETFERINKLLSNTDKTIAGIQPLEKKLQTTIHEVNLTLKNVHSISADLKKSTPDIKSILHNTNNSTAQLPDLLIETEASIISLRQLTDQLKSLWLLGGHQAAFPQTRLPIKDMHP